MDEVHDMAENCSVPRDIGDEFELDNFDETMVFVIYVSLLICAVLSNGLVCVVMARGKRLTKNFSNFHIFNLAMTEIVFRLVVSPYILYKDSVDEMKSGASCKVAVFFDYTTLGVTFGLLAGIACDRYLNICRPLQSRRISWKHSARTVLFTWLYAMSCSTPFLFSRQYGDPSQDILEVKNNTSCFQDEFKADFLLNRTTYDEEYKMCYNKSGNLLKLSSTIFIACAFVLPLLVIVSTYAAILRVLTKRSRSLTINGHIAQSRVKAVKMMAVIVLVYVLSWGPTLVVLQLNAFGANIFEEPTTKAGGRLLFFIEALTFLFSSTSSIANPLIFAYYSRIFRREVKTIFYKLKDFIPRRRWRFCCGQHKIIARDITSQTITVSFAKRIISLQKFEETNQTNGCSLQEMRPVSLVTWRSVVLDSLPS